MQFSKGLALICGSLAFLSAAGPALAEETEGPATDSATSTTENQRLVGLVACGDSVTAGILDVLLSEGSIDPAQYSASCARLRDDDAVLPKIAAARGFTKADPSWIFKWDNGFNLTRSDEAFKLKFGGRIMLDSEFHAVGGGLRNDFKTLGIDPKHGSGVEFRRARIFFSGDIYDRAFFKAQYDFAQANDDDNPDFKDVYLGLKKLGPVSSIRVGHFKEPMFLQEATSSKYITFMERGVNATFYPERNVGIMATGHAASTKLFWQLGVFRDANDQGFAFDKWGDEKVDLAGRVSIVPIYSEDGRNVLHVGAGYVHRFLDSSAAGNLRFRGRPEAHMVQRFVDTESFAAKDTDTMNLEIAYVHGPFSVQAEYTHAWIQGGTGQRDLTFRGFYAFASVFLTGEHRNYQLGKGSFGRVKPIENFDPANGKWGAVELALRYSSLDLRDRNVKGGELWDVTAGVNWYLYPNLRWMLNYVHADVSNRVSTAGAGGRISGRSDLAETRVQIDF